MKKKITRNDMKMWYNDIIKIGYCNAQHLLYCNVPQYYNYGVYGWNYDVYDFGNTAICTGYRPIGNINAPYEIVRKYDDMARTIVEGTDSYAVKAEKVHALRDEFIKEVLNN